MIVRPVPRVADAYEIIAGERRWRAAQRAGLHEIPIVVIDVGDREALELAIVENVQRADLNALEEANGYAQLGADYKYSPRRHRAHRRQEPQPCRQHAAADRPARAQPRAARRRARSPPATRAPCSPSPIPTRSPTASSREGLTVRDVERLAERAGQTPRPRGAKSATPIDADTRALEEKLGLALGTQVTIRHSGQAGELKIAFRDFDQLDDFCRRLSQLPR